LVEDLGRSVEELRHQSPQDEHRIGWLSTQRFDILEGSPPNGIPLMLNGMGGTGSHSYIVKTDFDDTKREVEKMSVELRTSIAGIGSSSFSTDPRIARVLERLGELEGRVTGEAFSLGSKTHSSHTEVAEWIVTEKVPTAGVFWDLFSVLVCMKLKRQTGKDPYDESHSSKRTGSTIIENNLVASMTHIRPELLYAEKGNGEIGHLEDGFCGCPSYAIWITGTKCFRGQMTDMLEKSLRGVQWAPSRTASYYVMVLLLATNVRAQWHKLCTFVDSFYIELTGVLGFATTKAWALVGRCVVALFGALQPYRLSVTMLEDL
jgi:hypothetical protein